MEGNKRTFLLFASIAICHFFVSEASGNRRSRYRHQQTLDANATHEIGEKRQGKMFSLFNVVSFRNAPCASTETLSGSSRQRNGTCYTTDECEDKGGRAEGNCASGFGVCCIFVVNANTGGEINYNCSYIQNPDYATATTTANTYSYTINKCDDEVCFIRLDFESFTLSGTGVSDESATCTTDTLVVMTNTNENIPTICGENAGQHIYFGIDQTATVQITLGGTTPSGLWDIKVSQIQCNNPMVPPDGCLQYSSGLTGRIETFNYASAMESHIYNLDYSHCIRAEAGFCCIQYQACANDATAMSLAVTADGTTALVPDTDDLCVTGDYLGIPGSSSVCDSGVNTAVDNAYCGVNLNNQAVQVNVPICDCTAPFYVHVHTDALPDSGIAGMNNALAAPISRGLCLEYSQIPC